MSRPLKWFAGIASFQSTCLLSAWNGHVTCRSKLSRELMLKETEKFSEVTIHTGTNIKQLK